VNFSLDGKSALVAGAARGIGQAICAALAAAGADVMGLDICAVAAPNLTYAPATPEQLAETGKMVERAKRRWIPVKADIRDANAMKEAVDRAVKEFGKLDIVVANAGIQAYGPLVDTSEEDWNNVIDINVKGSANTVRAALPHMLSRKYGRIVIISSGQGRHGFKNGSAYSTSKWGLIGLMKSVAWEVGKDGITVNCVEPGLVDTPLTRNPGRWRELIHTAGKQAPENPTEQEAITASDAELGDGHTMDAAGRRRASRGLSLHRRSQSREWRMLGRRGRRKREMDWLICFASTRRVLP
jgi:NAD(P)-dependent dehydrogenase (short-subunit alcohol dehydrogenase family)